MQPMASVEGDFCQGQLLIAFVGYLKTVDELNCLTLLRNSIYFECKTCLGKNRLCCASVRPGTDFGRQIIARAIELKMSNVNELAVWLRNGDFAWACAKWPTSFASKVDVKAICKLRTYTAFQACQIISSGNANCNVRIFRSLPAFARYESYVAAWHIWIHSGTLYAPWQHMIFDTLVAVLPLPEELIFYIMVYCN